MRDKNARYSCVKVDNEVYDAVMRASKHCPSLFQMLVSGYKQSNLEERLYKPITTKVCRDAVLRFWRYDDFALDYMLAQQFNYEFQILPSAWINDCDHISRLNEISLTSYAVLFEIQKYDVDLRTYLRKHRDYRKLNEILIQVVAGIKELH